jgi:alpha-1,2-mannosyltransferase
MGGTGGKDDRRRGHLLAGLAMLVPSALISASRSAALHRNYSAPLAIYRDLFYHASSSSSSSSSDDERTTYVCTAGEWHRFPSSFFLPPNHALGYLRSSFGGQLPQPFTEFGSRIESLAVQAGAFNDVNGEEADRYVDIGRCSYVVELVPPTMDARDDDEDDRRRFRDDRDLVPECLRYMESDASSGGGSWRLLASRGYLDAGSTHPTHRMLYIPFSGGSDKIAFGGYNLYMREET